MCVVSVEHLSFAYIFDLLIIITVNIDLHI